MSNEKIIIDKKITVISVTEAKKTIANNTKSLDVAILQLHEAFGLTLSIDVIAAIDIPAFAQSSMDGYAFNFNDITNALNISGEIAAGANTPLQINTGEAARIFTGAPLPEGADTVVMQEKIIIENNKLIIKDDALQQFSNVRAKGAEVKAGTIAMAAGTHLTAAAIGFLAGIGITHVAVYPPPVITIIITGNELQIPGNALQFGQVYEASSVMLTAALQKVGVKSIISIKVKDDKEALKHSLAKALQQSDIVLLTGGVSVGDYDFVVEVARACGIEQRFHKIKQRPGKPLFFGTKEAKQIFGLPGNPSSSLVCFYEYVLPMIEGMMRQQNSVIVLKARLTHNYPKAAGLTHFLKATYSNGNVTPLHAQESFRLHSFAQANCLIVLKEENENYKAGDEVEVHLI